MLHQDPVGGLFVDVPGHGWLQSGGVELQSMPIQVALS